ncbi:c-type cytochrome [Roseomonas marmotae]|uniref:Cytochrome c family protein n=1 Tax=Roseomonas marmotae TaxID=2768161 RepID=A0ABS3KGI5_9PROT|nr:cytochrome c family protein [Roseomonas marmotae]MBO1076582.1 cytochrome c family protein [Roseomonas marmotae]QTI79566.1 cytochrome c family protein [Roseomonas marmotae]
MSLEANKAFAAVLTAGIAFMVAGFIGKQIVHPKQLEKTAIAIEGVPAAGGGAPAQEEPALPEVGPLLAAANADNGRQIAGRLCSACHTFEDGQANKVGPNLYGVVGGPHAHRPDFNYSPAMAALKEKPWGYEEMNHFLAAPARYIRGTRMAFAGIRNAEQRADVIAYLRTLSANPQPLP